MSIPSQSVIRNCPLNSMQDSLSINFMPHIHLIILISVPCNASSFSFFSNHVSFPRNITPYAHVINLSLQQQGNLFSSEKGGHWPELEWTVANSGGHSSISISIHRRHVPTIVNIDHVIVEIASEWCIWWMRWWLTQLVFGILWFLFNQPIFFWRLFQGRNPQSAAEENCC